MLTGVVAIAFLLALSGAAGAKKKKKKKPSRVYTTHATLEFTPPGTFSGTVSASGKPRADRGRCVEGRTVTLLYFGPNGAPVAVLGIDKTNSRGRYLFNSQPFAFSGGYQLVVERQEIKGRRGKVTKCTATETPVRSV